MLEVGERAPDLQLQDPDGKKRSLGDLLAAGPAVLAFFKTTCPVCQFTFPFLERLKNGSISIYGICQDDAQDTRDFNREFRITFPVLLDTEDSGYPASNAYGIAYVPSVFLVEPDGKIGWAMEGFNRKALEALGRRTGVAPFRPGERIPDSKAG